MKQNQNLKIKGLQVTLIPYEVHHVPKYHSWMQSEELQELTASEPLTLQEEYEMQKSWREDENKCTFIVVKNEGFLCGSENEIECMIGDVNIFFNDEEDKQTGEIEIMIAETRARGKGKGKEALLLMMRYGVENLNMNRFTAKIGMDNIPSVKMFESIGFREISRSDVFKEVTVELAIDETFSTRLHEATRMFEILDYR